MKSVDVKWKNGRMISKQETPLNTDRHVLSPNTSTTLEFGSRYRFNFVSFVGDMTRSPTPTTELKGGLGSSNAPSNPLEEDASAETGPSAFGRRSILDPSSGAARPQQSFRGREAPIPSAKAIDLTAKEAAHFHNIQSSYGARMLANLGWKAGEGLGVNKDGRAVPVEAGKVMKGQGIQAGVRTEDSKREARRRGEVVSDDEHETSQRRGNRVAHVKPNRPTPDQSWKKQKKVKVKVEHKTYEQLLAEAGDTGPPGIGLVFDARGGEVSDLTPWLSRTRLIHAAQLKEVQSLSSLSLSSWTPTSDSSQLPELRHNLRLIVDVSKADVDGLAKEGKSVNERRRWALREEEKTRLRLEETARRLSHNLLTDRADVSRRHITNRKYSVCHKDNFKHRRGPD